MHSVCACVFCMWARVTFSAGCSVLHANTRICCSLSEVWNCHPPHLLGVGIVAATLWNNFPFCSVAHLSLFPLFLWRYTSGFHSTALTISPTTTPFPTPSAKHLFPARERDAKLLKLISALLNAWVGGDLDRTPAPQPTPQLVAPPHSAEPTSPRGLVYHPGPIRVGSEVADPLSGHISSCVTWRGPRCQIGEGRSQWPHKGHTLLGCDCTCAFFFSHLVWLLQPTFPSY